MSTDFPREASHVAVRGPERKPSVWVLITISTISPLSMNIYLPSMAGMVDAFSTTTGMVQLTMSLFLASLAFAQMFVGPISDRLGRRPLVVWGLGLYVIASIVCLFAPTIESLIAARIVQALGGSTGLVLSRAIIRDLYERDKAASMIGYVTMGMAVGPMLAPVVGGLLDGYFGWKGGFYTMAILGVVVWAAAYFNLTETNQARGTETGMDSLWKNMWLLLHEPLFWAYTMVVAFASALYFSYLGGAPFISARILGISPSEMGLYFMFVAAGYIFGNFISGRISERVGVLPMIAIGSVIPMLAIAAVTIAVIAEAYHPLALFLPMFFVGLGNGICLPSALSGAVSVRPELAGAASGLSGSAQIGFGAVSSTLVAWMLSDAMWPDTAWPMVAVMIFSGLATLLFVVAIRVVEGARNG